MDRTHLDQVIEAAHDAALAARPWEDVLCSVARGVGASGAALFTPTLDPIGRMLSAGWGTAADATDDYVAHWVTEDPWFPVAYARNELAHAGTVLPGRKVLPLRDLAQTGFYNDFFRPHDMAELVTLLVCDSDDPWAPRTHLSFFSSNHDRPPVPDPTVLQALWPHLRRAVQSHWVLRKARLSGQSAEQALEAMPLPTWVLRETLEIEFANTAAQRIGTDPTRRGWIKRSGPDGGRLSALGDVDATALRILVANAATTQGRLMVAALPSNDRVLRGVIRFAPLSDHSALAATWPAARVLCVLHVPAVADEAQLWHRHLANRYALTSAELRVLISLGEMQTPDEIATTLGVSVTTVRTHLARLFSKTGCRRQAELVRLALGA